MNKNIKKIGTTLLVAVVAVGAYFVSGTYAKYTSKISGNDTASVAKWAWNINNKDFTSNDDITNGYTFNLFETINDTKDNADETDVDDELIAPGTRGNFDIVITNKSEVNATYAIKFTETKSDANLPIEYSLDGSTWVSSVGNLDIAASETDTKLVSKTGTVTKTVYWRWAFIGADSTNYTSSQTDETDTALGFAANTTRPTVELKAEVTVTQID